MKSTMGDKSHDLPMLMINLDGDAVILATHRHEGNPNILHGTVVGGDAYDIGYHSEKWGAGFFIPFNGTVTLEN